MRTVGTLLVRCHRCNRAGETLLVEHDAVRVLGTVLPENGAPDGVVRTAPTQNRSAVMAITLADPTHAPGTGASVGRFKLACRSRAHRSPVLVPATQATLLTACRRALAAGRREITLAELLG